MEKLASSKVWSFGKKLSFRYIFVFFILIIFPFPINVIPGIDNLTEYYNQLWELIINFTAKTFFSIDQEISSIPTGSGDRLYDWLWYFCILLFTGVIGTLFSIVDKRRKNYEKLKAWFLLIVTSYLAYFLLVYGIIKLFYLQFIPPNLERLFQTFGQASPMRLMWTFMGFSESYTIFAGFSETVAGLLLIFRKTRTLGALVAAGVMLNVFMMNMSYDIPVKLFSFQLILIALYIAGQNFNRLFSFFILNQPIPAEVIYPYFITKRYRYVLYGIQVIFFAFIIYTQVDQGLNWRKTNGVDREKSALYGVYNVETFIQNNDTIAPLITDKHRWKRVLFDYPNSTSIIMMDDKVNRFNSSIDTLSQSITFSLRNNTENKHEFKYELNGDKFTLKGVLEKDSLVVEMNYYDLKNFGLLNRGFHWVNEVPYNRYNDD